MNKSVIKRLLIILIIICIVIACTIFIVIKFSPEVTSGLGDGQIEEESYDEELNYDIDENKLHPDEYKVVRDCVRQYIDTINFNNSNYYTIDENNNKKYVVDENEISKITYNLLSTDYINRNNINANNVFTKINKLNDLPMCTILSVKKEKKKETLDGYVAHIILQDIETYSILGEQYIQVNVDSLNMTFSIEPLGENKDAKDITFDKIEENDDNGFVYSTLSNEDITREYINLYKRLALSNPEYFYNNFLDEEYKNAKFGSAQEFTSYVQDNKQKISTINLKKYQVDVYGNEYTRYVALDQNNHYYIIKENQTMDFKMQLDTYTIDVPEFIEKYNSASDDKKASMNISKIVDAINDKDYKYVYNKLNETYKNSNFADINKFKEFLNNKFYDESVIKESTAKKDGDVYICNLKISDKEGTSKLVDVTILVRLSQGTNYEISFSM